MNFEDLRSGDLILRIPYRERVRPRGPWLVLDKNEGFFNALNVRTGEMEIISPRDTCWISEIQLASGELLKHGPWNTPLDR